MILQNYINFRWDMFFGSTGPNSPQYGVAGQNLVSVEGTKVTCGGKDTVQRSDLGTCMAAGLAMSATQKAQGIHFGTGSTPATLADYKLEAPITSGLSKVHTAISIAKEADGRYSVCGQYTVKNVSDQPMNIYEIGCVSAVPWGSSDTSYVLMERTVLNEPITIGRDETKLITYKLTFNHALNVEA